MNVTRYFLRCVADYCSASTSGTRSDDDELEAARCTTLTAYSHECTRVNNAGFAWRTQQRCRKWRTTDTLDYTTCKEDVLEFPIWAVYTFNSFVTLQLGIIVFVSQSRRLCFCLCFCFFVGFLPAGVLGRLLWNFWKKLTITFFGSSESGSRLRNNRCIFFNIQGAIHICSESNYLLVCFKALLSVP